MIGGGLPVGAYAGKRAIMQQVAPAGPMYQAGTLSGNPLAMTAGLVTLQELTKPGVFDAAAKATAQLVAGIEAAAKAAGRPIQAGCEGTMFGFYFLKQAGHGDHELCRGQAVRRPGRCTGSSSTPCSNAASTLPPASSRPAL